jgi:CRISPR-associated endonuclease/helicase Cas3
MNFLAKEERQVPTKFPAHIRIDGKVEKRQSVQDHCRDSAKIAQKTLSTIRLESSAYLAGLLHDAGKFTETFKDYIEKVVHGESLPRGSVNHTFAGVRYLLQTYHTQKGEDDLAPIVAELLAFSVGAHHGLFDCVDEGGHSGFQHRLDKPDIHYEEAINNFLAQCADAQELDQLFNNAVKELTPVLQSLCDLAQQNDSYDGEVSFYLSLLARLLLSAVIAGDRQDTNKFMNDILPTDWSADKKEIWEKCLARMEQKLTELSSDTPIDRARQTISAQCCDFAKQCGGVFRLNVPTGGGKTLASLRYALAHAAKWKKSRLIFTFPLLSIIDQNADVLRKYIQDDSLILEHHSNIVQPQKNEQDAATIIDKMSSELMMENWDAPIVITTLVQLLNTMFSGKTSCIRRFHALVNSVIVIDEVQTVPPRMLTLFNLAVNFLSRICGATIVLCSATQPCLEKTIHPITVPIQDIVPYDEMLWKVFHRTTIVNAGSRQLDEIPDFAVKLLENINSLLIVCNKKDEAAALYNALSGKEFQCYHLSSSMCMAHRRETLDNIQNSLEQDGKTICVSTQVIEAGVDISFECVIRLTAGLDNIIQAAGRCNRHGKQEEPVPVYTLNCKDEKLGHLQDIQDAKTATISLLTQFEHRPHDFKNNLFSDESVEYYYQRLYQEMPSHFQDYTVVKGKPSIYSMLSLNENYCPEDGSGFALNQAFKTAGELFRVFDEDTVDVLVPYGEEGKKCIENLCSEQVMHDPAYLQKCLKEAKLYTVSLLEYQKERLKERGGLYAICDNKVLVVQSSYYDENVGLLTEAAQTNYLEVI